MGGGLDQSTWALAREVGAPIVNHVVGNSAGLEAMGKAGLMKADNEYIHCTQLSEAAWKMIADTRRPRVDRDRDRDADAARHAADPARRSITASRRA